MVRTRHDGDDLSPKLLSSRQGRTRHTELTNGLHDEEHQQAFPDVSPPPKRTRHAYNLDDGLDGVMESRLRSRDGPSRAYNYLDADSSDEESYRRRQRRHEKPALELSPRRRRSDYRSHKIKQEMIEDHHQRAGSRRRRQRAVSRDESDDEPAVLGLRSSRRRRHSKEDSRELVEDYHHSPRRSNVRTRRQSVNEDHPDSDDDENLRRGKVRPQRQQQPAADEHHGDSQDDNENMRRSNLRTRRKPVSDEQHDSDDDNLRRGSSRTRRQPANDERHDSDADNLNHSNLRRTRRQPVNDHPHDIDVVERPKRSRRSKQVQIAEESQESQDSADDDAMDNRRRSSRRRRQIHNSLNQSDLVSQQNDELTGENDPDTEDGGRKEFSDMYSRVKRKRVHIKRDMYGVPIHDDSDSDHENQNDVSKDQDDEEEDEEEEEDDDDEEDDDEEGEDQIDDNNHNKRNLRKRRVKRSIPITRKYSLRENKPRTVLYKAPNYVEEKRPRRESVFQTTPVKKTDNRTYQSPALRRRPKKRSAHHSSSTSSSSSGDSSDEEKFQRRKSKSMVKARSKMMPMNFDVNEIPTTIKDRVKSGASLADVEPMAIDKSVTFDSIGGLGKHIRQLKEMIVFPLLYEGFFKHFKVDPPKGVLFSGPPGTGKTLTARALANECSHGNKKVSFFMRKGADCLSKWVGESEGQLRLLFDQAYKYRPSIIFFDEIDGLAPVRSSRQDQIHSSIVSTLLALMDGLDSRGEIVVIGATNRIDSIDPALRRPGRFDKEFFFPLPTLEARKQILQIHTSQWSPKLNDGFISQLAEKCVGYCGADLKALCTEATMLALRRRYPQIYFSNEALQIDESSVKLSAKDFFGAHHQIIPASQRSVSTPGRALSVRLCPLLQSQLDKVLDKLDDIFPLSLAQVTSVDAAATSSQAQAMIDNGSILDDMGSDEEEDAPSIFVAPSQKGGKNIRKNLGEGTSKEPVYLNCISYETNRPQVFRPRLLLTGEKGQGQSYIGPAVIHKMENLPVHTLDVPSLYCIDAKTPEESCANKFHEAKRKCPSIIYIPHIDKLWDVLSQSEPLKQTFLSMVDLDPTLPLMILATSDLPYEDLDEEIHILFEQEAAVTLTNPGRREREGFFKDLFLHQACKPPPQRKQAVTNFGLLPVNVTELVSPLPRVSITNKPLPKESVTNKPLPKGSIKNKPLPKGAITNKPLPPPKTRQATTSKNKNQSSNVCDDYQQHLERNISESYRTCSVMSLNLKPISSRFMKPQRILEVLPKAAPAKPRELNKDELKMLIEKEELTLMELRIFLRDVLNKLGSDKKFSIFAKPVDIEDAPDYYEVIEHPMDLSTMMSKIDLHEYNTVAEFMKDIDLICVNALEYNPNRGPMDRIIRHRACAMKDTAYAIIKTELDKSFEKMCVEIQESRKKRGQKPVDVPNFYYTKPIEKKPAQNPGLPSYLENAKPARSIPTPDGERFSKRVRGLHIEPVPTLESVEKRYNRERTGSPVKDTNGHASETNPSVEIPAENNTDSKSEDKLESSVKKCPGRPPSDPNQSNPSSKKKKPKVNVWCKPRRKRPRLMFSRTPRERKDSQSIDEDEEEEMDTSQEGNKDDSLDCTPVGQELSVDTSVNNNASESKEVEMKSPSRRLSSPMGVSTRRTSASPRGGGHGFVADSVKPDSSSVKPSEVNGDAESRVPPTDGSSVVAAAEERATLGLLSGSQNKANQEQVLELQASSDNAVDGKPSVVKRLDLEQVAVDSGAGSSVDSNGDSRDSLDHTGANNGKKIQNTQKETDLKQVNELGSNLNNSAISKAAQRLLSTCAAGPSGGQQQLVVSEAELRALLGELVDRTEGYVVERLDRLHTQLSLVVHRHRGDYDRTSMVQRLRAIVQSQN